MAGKTTMECVVCLLKYDLGDHMPTSLRCMHTFCKQCVTTLTKRNKVNCPTCRRESKATNATTNFVVAGILESLCEHCTEQDKDCTCNHCGKVLCTSCIQEHTKVYHEKVKSDLAELWQTIRSATDKSMDQTQIEQEHERRQKVIEEINKAIRFHRQAIDDLEKSLEDEVAVLHDNNMQDHMIWQRHTQHALVEAREFVQTARSDISVSLKRITTEKLKTVHDKCTRVKAEIEVAINNIAQLTNYTFHVSEEQTTINVGKILTKPTSSAMRRPEDTRAAQAPLCVNDNKSLRYKSMTGTKGDGPYQFRGPLDVTCTQDRIYISDEWNSRVKVYNYDLELMFTVGTQGNGLSQFNNPRGVATGPGGELYVIDNTRNRIKVYNRDGSVLRTFGCRGAGAGELEYPQALAISDDGKLFVCDSANYRVQVMQGDGKYLYSIGSQGSQEGQFQYWPLFVALTSNSKVLVTQFHVRTISVFTLDGQFLEYWPKNLPATLKDGETRGVCVDQHDNIIVSYNSGCLVVLDKDGVYVCSFGTEGAKPGEMRCPYGVGVRADGEVVVCDWGNDRIQVFALRK